MDRMSKKRFNELNVYLSKKLVEICKIKKIHKINNTVWYNDEKLFFKGIISLGINEEKNVLMCSYIEKIKPMWIDNLLWDIMNMSDNEKNAQSLRANGAFTYNGYQTDFKSTVVETWSEMEIEKCICNYLFDFINTTQNVTIEQLNSKIFENEKEDELYKLLYLINNKEYYDAIEHLKSMKNNYFINKGKSLREYSQEYCVKKIN